MTQSSTARDPHARQQDARRQHARRIVTLWVPDWPIVAALRSRNLEANTPAVIVERGRVTVTSAFARRAGVRRGMKRRLAQEACPSVVIFANNEDEQHAAFEPVAAAAHEALPRWTTLRPGVLWAYLPGRLGGQDDPVAIAESICERLAVDADTECQVGVAGTVFSSFLAARNNAIIDVGEDSSFLAAQPVRALELIATQAIDQRAIEELVQSLRTLGIRTLGQLVQVGAGPLHTRFGAAGWWAYRHASGEAPAAVNPWEAADDFNETVEIDPPALRSDHVMFAAASTADRWYQRLIRAGLSCARVEITVTTVTGEELRRTWQADAAMWGGLAPRRVLDRLRWQLDGWRSDGGNPPVGSIVVDGSMPDDTALDHVAVDDAAADGIAQVCLRALDVHPVDSQQEGLWGLGRSANGRVTQTVDRLCGLMGAHAVFRVVMAGGRTTRERVKFVPWGQPDQREDTHLPWPEALPAPSPPVVLDDPIPVIVRDAAARPVVVSRRLQLSGHPHRIELGNEVITVQQWAGPWPLLQRWWDGAGESAAYLQVVTTNGDGLLLATSGGQWRCEGRYD